MQPGPARQRPGEGPPRPGLGEEPTGGVAAPSAVIVSGPPASGKTTLATALASVLNYAIMDLDTVTGPVTRAALRVSAGDETAFDSPAGAALRAPRYEALLDVAAANLAIGVGVVIAAPFTAERESVELFGEVARRLLPGEPGDHVALLYIDAPDALVRTRLEARNAARDRAKLAQPPAPASTGRLVPETIVLDGRQGIASQLTEALDSLARLQKNRRPTDPQAAQC